MAKWTSGRSERTFNQSAANSRNEPRVTDAAPSTDGCIWREGDIRCGTAETGANVSKRTSLALSMGEN